MRLTGRVAIVTGSTRGIGRACALRFAEAGARVVVTGRTADAGRAVEEAITAAGGEALYVRTDLADESDVVAMVDGAVDRFGTVTTLVDNAAPTDLVGPGRLDRRVTEITNEAWDAILRVGLQAVVGCCKYTIPVMAEGGGGSVVNISSAASLLGTPGITGYTVTKGALNALTRSLAVDHAAEGVRVNAIVSGMVLSSPGAAKLMDDPAIGGATRAMHLTRLGIPDDIAWAALYLSSDEAAFVTGAVIPVDGGVTCRMPVPDLSAADVDVG
jgi:3-oxoacyl-[acyl-carrier protein] reductase